jgi:putative flippase GtrA
MAEIRATAGTAVRFGLAGAVNTLVTGALLSWLARVIDPSLAYALIFALGIALSTVLAGTFVFRTRLSRRHVVSYVALYVTVFLVGLVTLRTAIMLGMPHGASGLVVLVTAPLTFIGARLVFRRPDAGIQAKRAEEPGSDTEKGLR